MWYWYVLTFLIGSVVGFGLASLLVAAAMSDDMHDE